MQSRLGRVVDVKGLFRRYAVVKFGGQLLEVKTRTLNIGDDVLVTKDADGLVTVQKVLPPKKDA